MKSLYGNFTQTTIHFFVAKYEIYSCTQTVNCFFTVKYESDSCARTAINFLQRNAEFRILSKRLIVGFFDHKVQNTKFRIVLKWSFFL